MASSGAAASSPPGSGTRAPPYTQELPPKRDMVDLRTELCRQATSSISTSEWPLRSIALTYSVCGTCATQRSRSHQSECGTHFAPVSRQLRQGGGLYTPERL